MAVTAAADMYTIKAYVARHIAIAGKPAPTGFQVHPREQVGCPAVLASRLASTGVRGPFRGIKPQSISSSEQNYRKRDPFSLL